MLNIEANFRFGTKELRIVLEYVTSISSGRQSFKMIKPCQFPDKVFHRIPGQPLVRIFGDAIIHLGSKKPYSDKYWIETDPQPFPTWPEDVDPVTCEIDSGIPDPITPDDPDWPTLGEWTYNEKVDMVIRSRFARGEETDPNKLREISYKKEE